MCTKISDKLNVIEKLIRNHENKILFLGQNWYYFCNLVS